MLLENDQPPASRELAASLVKLVVALSDLIAEHDSLAELSDVAERTGLNAGLVKYYFGGKDRLLLATPLHVAVPGVEALERLAAARNMSPQRS